MSWQFPRRSAQSLRRARRRAVCSQLELLEERVVPALIASGTELHVNTTTTLDQNQPAVAMDAAGDYVVAWSDYSVSAGNPNEDTSVLKYEVFFHDGTNSGELTANTSATPEFELRTEPSVAMDPNGDFVIAWRDNNQGNEDANGYYVYDIEARRFQITGDTVSPQTIAGVGGAGATTNEFQVDTLTTTLNGFQVTQKNEPSVAMDANGDFVIAFDTAEGANSDVAYRRFSSSGDALDAHEVTVNQFAAGAQSDPSVAMDASGDFVIVWQSVDQVSGGSGADIFARRFSFAGAAQSITGVNGATTGDAQINTVTAGEQDQPTVAEDASGSFVIAWESQGEVPGSGNFDIFDKYYNADGTLNNDNTDADNLVNVTTTKEQEHPSASMDSLGNVLIAWDSNSDAIYERRLNNRGVPIGTADVRVDPSNLSPAPTQVSNPAVALMPVDPATTAEQGIVVYESEGHAGDAGFGIYGQLYQYKNLAPTLNAITSPPALPENAPAQTINLTGITDGDGENQVLTVTISNDTNPGLFSSAPTVTYTNPNTTGSLSFTPAANASGTATITVQVQDNGGTINGGTDATARTFTVTVAAPPNITQQPSDQNVLVNTTGMFTATASTTSPPLSVQWQVSTGGAFTNINTVSNPSAATDTLSLANVQDAQNGNEYQAVFTDSVGQSTTTNPATLNVQDPPVIVTNPTDQPVTFGQTATFSASATGNPTPTVQWQVSTGGGPFTNIDTVANPSAATTTLTLTDVQTAMSGNKYRAVFSNMAGGSLQTATTTAATLTVTASSDLAVTKTGPTTAIAGNQITYTVTVINNGPNDSPAVSMTDTLPAGTTFVSQTQANSGPQFTLANTGNAITDTIPVLSDSASQTFTITATINADTAAGSLTNTANVASTGSTDPMPGNNASMATTTVTTQADVTVVKTGPATAIAGNQVTYTVTVSNPGPSDAQGVSLADTLPTGTTFGSQSQGNTGPQFTLGNTGNAINDTITTLAEGATQTFIITATINASTPSGTLSNTATGSTTTADPNIATDGTSTASTNVSTQADVTVVKTGPANAIAGNPITYTVTVTNNGPSDAQGVSLADTLPTGTTFVNQTQANAGPQFTLSNTGNAITDTLSTLAEGATQTFTITATINASTPAGTLSNTATATTTTSDPNIATDGTSTANTNVTTQADVTVVKTGPATALAGNQIIYTIAISNPGPSDAQGVSLADTLPTGTSFVSQSEPGTGPQFTLANAGNAVSDTIATLAAGASQSITIVAQIGSGTAAGTLSNTATASTTTSDPNIATDGTSTASTTVATQADLVVTNTYPTTALAGTDITYQISLTNDGPSDALNADFGGSVGGPASIVSFTQDSGPSRGSTLPAGETETYTLVVAINASASNNSVVTNTGSASTSTSDPEIATHGTLSDTTTVSTQADLVVTKTGPATAIAGNPITYTVTVANDGPSDAQGVALNDVLPAGTTFVSDSGAPGWTTSDPAVGGTGTIDDTIATLPANGSATFTIVLQISPSFVPGTLSNTATASTTTSDPNITTDGTSTANTTISTQADLLVTKTAPATDIAGTPITYTVTIANNGPSDAQTVALADTLPAGTAFVSQTQPNTGPQFTLSNNGNAISDTIGTLAAGASQTFTITALIASSTLPGTLSNTATATTTTSDPNIGTHGTSTASTTVQTEADLSIAKSGPALAVAGDPNGINYTLTVTDNGPSDNTGGFTVSDPLPAGFSFQSAGSTAGGSLSGQMVSFTNTTGLSNGATETFIIHVTIASSVPDMTTVQNTATVVSNGTTDPKSTNNTSNTVDTLVRAGADLSIAKSGPATAIAGAPSGFNYTLVVTNNGFLNNVGGFTVTDVLPAGLTFQTTGSTPGASLSGQKVSFTNTTGLASGATENFVIHVTLASSAVNSSLLLNSATVVSNGTIDPNPNNNTSNTLSTTVQTSADLSVSNTLNGAKPTGQTQTFTVSVTNNGPSDAQAVVLTDSLPANTVLVSETQNSGPAFHVSNASSGGVVTLTFTAPTLVTGASASFTLVSQLASPEPNGYGLSSIANVTSSTADPNTQNNQAVAKALLSVTTDLALSVTSTSNPNPLSGDGKVAYTLTLTNNGPNAAQNVVLTDTLPTNTALRSIAQLSGPTFSMNAPAIGSMGGTATWTIPTLALGQSATFSILVQLTNGTSKSVTNSATVTSATTDSNTSNNSVTTTTPVVATTAPPLTKATQSLVVVPPPAIHALDLVLGKSTGVVADVLQKRAMSGRRHRLHTATR